MRLTVSIDLKNHESLGINMAIKINISEGAGVCASTALADDVYISNDLIFNKLLCQNGEVICFHDAIASVLKGKYLSKVYRHQHGDTAFRWFSSLEDAVACYGLGTPDYENSTNWRETEKSRYENLTALRISQAQSMQQNYQPN